MGKLVLDSKFCSNYILLKIYLILAELLRNGQWSYRVDTGSQGRGRKAEPTPLPVVTTVLWPTQIILFHCVLFSLRNHSGRPGYFVFYLNKVA